MRKLWIAAGALLLLFAAVGIAAVWSLNRLIAGNQDRIIAQMQAALGRDLRVAHISLSLRGGLGVRLDDQTQAPVRTTPVSRPRRAASFVWL